MPVDGVPAWRSDPYDVIVVGGSYAGLSAALAPVRTRNRVLIVDSRLRRNRFVASVHSLLEQGGPATKSIVHTGRAEVAACPTATPSLDRLPHLAPRRLPLWPR